MLSNKRNKKTLKGISRNINLILKEIRQVLKTVDNEHVYLAVKEILDAGIIIVCGAGRMGLMAKAFAMRLGHLGLKAYTMGDSTVPSIGKKDLLIICSGSGETKTVYDIAFLAKQQKAKILLFSSYIDHYKSPMAKISDTVVVINAPSKARRLKGFNSIQPMTTLYEQSLLVFLDALVLILMQKLGKTQEDMWMEHSNLE